MATILLLLSSFYRTTGLPLPQYRTRLRDRNIAGNYIVLRSSGSGEYKSLKSMPIRYRKQFTYT